MTWPTKKLGEVCDFKVIKNTKLLPYVGMEDVEGGTGRFIGNKDPRKVKSSTAYFNQSCVLYGKLRPYLNKVFVPDFEGHSSTEFIPLRPDNKLLTREWLATWLMSSSVVERISNNVAGSRMPRANLDFLKNLEIPLPPLSKQKKMVAKLENLLAKIKEAKRLRAEAQEATQNLLSAELHQIFEEGKKKGWEEKELSLLTEKTRMVDPKKEFESEFNYIDISSVSNSSESILAKNISSKEAPSRARKLVKEGDAIFATTRPYLKNIAFITKDLDGSIASTGFCVLRAKKELLDSKYLFLVVNSNPFVEEVSSFQKGATYPAVADSVIFSRKILLPSLSEQKKIVARLDALSEKIKKLRDYQKSTQSDLVALEQSILNQAFSRDK